MINRQLDQDPTKIDTQPGNTDTNHKLGVVTRRTFLKLATRIASLGLAAYIAPRMIQRSVTSGEILGSISADGITPEGGVTGSDEFNNSNGTEESCTCGCSSSTYTAREQIVNASCTCSDSER